MSLLNNKIECIKRLISTGNHIALIEWLIESKLVPGVKFEEIKSNQTMAELIVLTLSELLRADKLMLLDYEWTILPREFIRITIVTEKEKQEFTYNI